MYRAHLERYAASLAAASGNPSLALDAASSLSPYAMLAAGYPPTALGLVPPSSIVQPPLHDPLASTTPSSLTLSLPPKIASSSEISNQNQNSAAMAVSKPSVDNINPNAPNELAISTTPSVLQQRLSTFPKICPVPCIIQGDPNQSFPFEMAVTPKLSSFDPMLVKPKCV